MHCVENYSCPQCLSCIQVNRRKADNSLPIPDRALFVCSYHLVNWTYTVSGYSWLDVWCFYRLTATFILSTTRVKRQLECLSIYLPTTSRIIEVICSCLAETPRLFSRSSKCRIQSLRLEANSQHASPEIFTACTGMEPVSKKPKREIPNALQGHGSVPYAKSLGKLVLLGFEDVPYRHRNRSRPPLGHRMVRKVVRSHETKLSFSEVFFFILTFRQII